MRPHQWAKCRRKRCPEAVCRAYAEGQDVGWRQAWEAAHSDDGGHGGPAGRGGRREPWPLLILRLLFR